MHVEKKSRIIYKFESAAAEEESDGNKSKI